MTERGVIAVDRAVFDHPRFADEPFTEREAWIWLIGQAAFAAHHCRRGSVMVSLKRGQLAHSTRFMAQRWKWSEASVRRFLKSLASRISDDDDAMIDAVSDAGVTVITIRNYGVYRSYLGNYDAARDALNDAKGSAAPPELKFSDALNVAPELPLRSCPSRNILDDGINDDAPKDAGVTQVRRKEESIDKDSAEEPEEGRRAPPANITEATDWDRDFAGRFLKVIGYGELQIDQAREGFSLTIVVWRTRGYDPAWILAIAAELIADGKKKHPLSYFTKAIASRHDARAREIALTVLPSITPKAESNGHAATPQRHRQDWQIARDRGREAHRELKRSVDEDRHREGGSGQDARFTAAGGLGG